MEAAVCSVWMALYNTTACIEQHPVHFDTRLMIAMWVLQTYWGVALAGSVYINLANLRKAWHTWTAPALAQFRKPHSS